jgi:hypothetical protein
MPHTSLPPRMPTRLVIGFIAGVPSMMVLGIVLHAVFGLGTAGFFWLGRHLGGGRAPLSPASLSGR